MKQKILFSSLIMGDLLYASSYTYSICTTTNLENAKNCITQNIKKPTADIFIIHDSDGKYRTNYGAFSSYKEAKDFKPKLSKTLITQGAFVKEYDLDLIAIPHIQGVNYKEVDLTLPSKETKKVTIASAIIPSVTPQVVENISKLTSEPIVVPVANKVIPNIKPTASIDKKEQKQNPNKATVEIKSTPPEEIQKINQPHNEIKVAPIVVEEPIKEEKIVQKSDNKDSTSKISLSLAYSPLALSGEVRYANGTKMDFDNNLGISKSKTTFIPKLSLALDKHMIFTSYFTNTYNGSKTLTADSTLNNYTFSANQNITSELNTKWYQSGYRYNFMKALIGFDIIGFDSELKVSNSTNNTNVTSSLIIPTANIDMSNNLEQFYISYGGGIGKTNAASYYEYYLGITKDCLLISNALWNIGYMDKKLDIQDGLYDGTSQYSGVYINFTKSF